jgi:hypothetical protein
MERPVARDTRWASRTNGHPDGCPTEDGRAPVGGGQVLDGGSTGARRRAHGCSTEGARVPDRKRDGWPDEGVYKSGWPTFLGILLQRPISPTRNADAQGPNE